MWLRRDKEAAEGCRIDSCCLLTASHTHTHTRAPRASAAQRNQQGRARLPRTQKSWTRRRSSNHPHNCTPNRDEKTLHEFGENAELDSLHIRLSLLQGCFFVSENSFHLLVSCTDGKVSLKGRGLKMFYLMCVHRPASGTENTKDHRRLPKANLIVLLGLNLKKNLK